MAHTPRDFLAVPRAHEFTDTIELSPFHRPPAPGPPAVASLRAAGSPLAVPTTASAAAGRIRSGPVTPLPAGAAVLQAWNVQASDWAVWRTPVESTTGGRAGGNDPATPSVPQPAHTSSRDDRDYQVAKDGVPLATRRDGGGRGGDGDAVVMSSVMMARRPHRSAPATPADRSEPQGHAPSGGGPSTLSRLAKPRARAPDDGDEPQAKPDWKGVNDDDVADSAAGGGPSGSAQRQQRRLQDHDRERRLDEREARLQDWAKSLKQAEAVLVQREAQLYRQEQAAATRHERRVAAIAKMEEQARLRLADAEAMLAAVHSQREETTTAISLNSHSDSYALRRPAARSGRAGMVRAVEGDPRGDGGSLGVTPMLRADSPPLTVTVDPDGNFPWSERMSAAREQLLSLGRS